MTTIFASDFHGTGDAYINKIEKMRAKYPAAQIVFGGDYIDGRKYSKQVLNYIRQMQINHHAVVLKGNHEDLMLEFVRSGNRWDYDAWRENGGNTTYRSLVGKRIRFSVAQEALQQVELYDGTKLVDWMNRLQKAYVNDDACFVHAQLTLPQHPEEIETTLDNSAYPSHHVETFIKHEPHPVYPIEDAIKNTSEETALWGRDFIQLAGFWHNYSDHAIVVGHTPTCYFTYASHSEGLFVTEYRDDNSFKQKLMCPIMKMYRENERPIIACDGGCHGKQPYNTGNVLVIDHGEVVDYKC